MPTIDDLLFTVSRDSHGRVAVQVTYTPGYNTSEWTSQVQWDWRVLLVRVVGERDRPEDVVARLLWGIPELEPPDVLIAVLSSEVDYHPATLTPPTLPPKTITHVLSAEELELLRVAGREHVYVVVFAMPMAVKPAYAYAAVDIDIGDPGE